MMTKKTEPRELISFDFAIKYLFRNKANFAVLEGFLTDLFEKPIQILELLESESNKINIDDKSNRVDVLVKDDKDDIYIIELQYGHQNDFIERIIYGVSKAVIEHMRAGEAYSNIRKIISISIIYFPLFDKRNSTDCIFHNSVEFRGLRDNEPIGLYTHRYVKTDEGQKLTMPLYNPFPEYYFIDVNSFSDEITKPIDEWLFMLRHNYFKKSVKSTNIDKAEDALNYINLNQQDKKIYDAMKEGRERNISTLMSAEDKGRLEEKLSMVKSMKDKQLDIQLIIEISGLSKEEIDKL